MRIVHDIRHVHPSLHYGEYRVSVSYHVAGEWLSWYRGGQIWEYVIIGMGPVNTSFISLSVGDTVWMAKYKKYVTPVH